MIARRDLAVQVAARAGLSPTCFRLVLATSERLEATPGQFGMLACSGGFDPLLRRAFSLAGVTRTGAETRVELLVKEVGKGTALLRRAPLGAELRLLAPLGNGFDLTAPDLPLALAAGGIGLPPVLFAAEVLASRGVRFDFYLGANNAAELLEVERCRAAAGAAGGGLFLTTDDGSRGEAGFLTAALARRLAAGHAYARVLACGPNAMLAALARLAAQHGIAAELSLEEPMGCGVGVCLGCVVELADGHYVPACKEGPVFAASRLAERWWL
ncbi:MAG: dihydroorotate dehydrogenase electron transfer subunit [Thermoanaerobaculales bacterium]